MAKLVALVHNKIDYCASVVCYCHCWSNQWWPHINQTTSVVAQPLLLNESHRAQTTLKTSDRCATMLRFLKKCKCILSQLMDPHHSSWRPKSRRRAKHSWMFIHCVKTRLTLLIKEVNSQVFMVFENYSKRCYVYVTLTFWAIFKQCLSNQFKCTVIRISK